MKIAQIVCVYPPYRGGIGSVAQKYSKFLSNRGHEVTVFTPKKNDINYSDEKVTALSSYLSLGNAAILKGLFANLKNYDLVYLHYPFFGTTETIFLLKKLFKFNFKLVIHYHMDTDNLSLFKRLFLFPDKLIKKSLFNMADCITCASLDYLEESSIKEIYKKNKEKFFELPFSVDTELFQPQERENDIKKILFVGGMDKAHYFKGVDILLKAFSLLKRKDLELNLVGNGSLVANYKNLAKNLGIDKYINFLENVDDDELKDIYANSDILVLASVNKHEAFGIVLLEAMSSGIPVIASNLRGVRKVFEDSKQGYYFEKLNADDLKEKINKLLDKDKNKLMGKAARKLALEKYSDDAAENRLDNLVKSIYEDSFNK